MNEFSEALSNTFGFKKPVAQKSEVPTITVDRKTYNTRNSVERTLGEPTVVAAAQAIFNPQQPVAPSPQASAGTADKMGLKPGWGGGQ
jgi:hypothetical protein